MVRGSRLHGGQVGRASVLRMVAVTAILTGSLLLGLTGCAQLDADTDSTGVTLPDLPTTEPTRPDSTSYEPPVNPVSEESRDYAAWLGGESWQGETLHFVIGASVGSEAQAEALLEPAKAVGDMQSNFIVQLSDNFEGMTPGYWVVFEAYDGYPSEEDLQFCRRPFPDAYVKTATVLTDDPIPVRPGG